MSDTDEGSRDRAAAFITDVLLDGPEVAMLKMQSSLIKEELEKFLKTESTSEPFMQATEKGMEAYFHAYHETVNPPTKLPFMWGAIMIGIATMKEVLPKEKDLRQAILLAFHDLITSFYKDFIEGENGEALRLRMNLEDPDLPSKLENNEL